MTPFLELFFSHESFTYCGVFLLINKLYWQMLFCESRTFTLLVFQ